MYVERVRNTRTVSCPKWKFSIKFLPLRAPGTLMKRKGRVKIIQVIGDEGHQGNRQGLLNTAELTALWERAQALCQMEFQQ